MSAEELRENLRRRMYKELLKRLDAAEKASGPVPCLGNCFVSEMESDINSKDVCDVCRAHWLILEAQRAVKKLLEEP